MKQPENKRGATYTRLKQIGWYVPNSNNEDYFWAYQAYKLSGLKSVYGAIMDAEYFERAEEFTRLYTYGWSLEGQDRRYHWGKKAFYLVGG